MGERQVVGRAFPAMPRLGDAASRSVASDELPAWTAGQIGRRVLEFGATATVGAPRAPGLQPAMCRVS